MNFLRKDAGIMRIKFIYMFILYIFFIVFIINIYIYLFIIVIIFFLGGRLSFIKVCTIYVDERSNWIAGRITETKAPANVMFLCVSLLSTSD